MRRYILTVVVIATAVAGSSYAAGERLAVGIAEFTWQGYRTQGIASGARAVIETELHRSPDIRLVERQHLEALLEEGAFQQSGVTSTATAVELGGLDNVRMLLFGDVARVNAETASLSLKLVDVATGRVVHMEAANLPSQGIGRDRVARRLGARLAAIASGLLPSAMITVPGGTLHMGRDDGPPEEGPAHNVYIDSFAIDRTETSRAAFSIWAAARRQKFSLDAQPRYPAANVTWGDASAYCISLGKRLPTEAEWEMAARSLDGRSYPWGAQLPTAALAQFAAAGPTQVDAFAAGASAEGALQLSGNVAEWVADWWSPIAYRDAATENSRGPAQGEYKVIRGGSYADPPQALGATSRSFHTPMRGSETIGFRCVRTLSP